MSSRQRLGRKAAPKWVWVKIKPPGTEGFSFWLHFVYLFFIHTQMSNQQRPTKLNGCALSGACLKIRRVTLSPSSRCWRVAWKGRKWMVQWSKASCLMEFQTPRHVIRLAHDMMCALSLHCHCSLAHSQPFDHLVFPCWSSHGPIPGDHLLFFSPGLPVSHPLVAPFQQVICR